jgi:hypothetical protein
MFLPFLNTFRKYKDDKRGPDYGAGIYELYCLKFDVLFL